MVLAINSKFWIFDTSLKNGVHTQTNKETMTNKLENEVLRDKLGQINEK